MMHVLYALRNYMCNVTKDMAQVGAFVKGNKIIMVTSIILLILNAHKHVDIKHYDFIKLRWDEMNHEDHRFKCTLIEGGGLNKYFSHFAYNFSILPGTSSDSCVMHYTVEFVDIGEHTFHDFIKAELEKFCKSLDSHLLNIS